MYFGILCISYTQILDRTSNSKQLRAIARADKSARAIVLSRGGVPPVAIIYCFGKYFIFSSHLTILSTVPVVRQESARSGSASAASNPSISNGPSPTL